MTTDVNVSDIRRKAMSAYMSDGIWELFLGTMLLLIGWIKLDAHFSGGEEFQPQYIVFVIIFALVVIPRIKARLTFPRIGYVDVKRFRQRSTWTLVLFLGILTAGSIGMIFFARTPAVAADTSARFMGLYFAIFVAVVLSTMGVLRNAVRMHYVSALFIVVFGILFFLNVYSGFGFVITGAVMLLIGGVTLMRFLRVNPVLPPDDYEGSASDA